MSDAVGRFNDKEGVSIRLPVKPLPDVLRVQPVGHQQIGQLDGLLIGKALQIHFFQQTGQGHTLQEPIHKGPLFPLAGEEKQNVLVLFRGHNVLYEGNGNVIRPLQIVKKENQFLFPGQLNQDLCNQPLGIVVPHGGNFILIHGLPTAVLPKKGKHIGDCLHKRHAVLLGQASPEKYDKLGKHVLPRLQSILLLRPVASGSETAHALLLIHLLQHRLQKAGLPDTRLPQHSQTDAFAPCKKAFNGAGDQIPLLLPAKEKLSGLRGLLHGAAL